MKKWFQRPFLKKLFYVLLREWPISESGKVSTATLNRLIMKMIARKIIVHLILIRWNSGPYVTSILHYSKQNLELFCNWIIIIIFFCWKYNIKMISFLGKPNASGTRNLMPRCHQQWPWQNPLKSDFSGDHWNLPVT